MIAWGNGLVEGFMEMMAFERKGFIAVQLSSVLFCLKIYLLTWKSYRGGMKRDGEERERMFYPWFIAQMATMVKVETVSSFI